MTGRCVFILLMIISLLLTGCGEAARLEKDFENARESWREAEKISFKAEISAELYDSLFTCTLFCSHEDGETLVEILAPENISGIRARLREGEASLEYDGLILAIGDPMNGEVSPLAAMPLIVSALLDGHVTLLWNETEEGENLTAVEVYVDENSSLRLWFARENFLLSHAELVSGGKAVVKCRITEFTKE